MHELPELEGASSRRATPIDIFEEDGQCLKVFLDFKRARGEYFASLTKSDALPSIRVPGAERMRRIVEIVTWREDKGET